MGIIGTVIVFMLILSFIGMIIMGLDKRKARRGDWRIPEKHLWFIAWIGGALGMWLGMYLFRHKTKHLIFKFGFPILTVVQWLFLIYVHNLS